MTKKSRKPFERSLQEINRLAEKQFPIPKQKLGVNEMQHYQLVEETRGKRKEFIKQKIQEL